MQGQIEIGYWAIRGLGQYVRLTLEAAGLKYEEKRYSDEDSWFKRDKPKLPVLLPNIPYYIEGDIAISESDSIVRTIARLHKPELLGRSPQE